MTYDCLMFNDELDLLEIRLHHHSPLVDAWVIIESSRTYSGVEKPLNYWENRERFSKFHHRIHHVMLNFPFMNNALWNYEHKQRNMLRGFPFHAEDTIVYTDTDEIMRGEEVLREFRKRRCDIASLQMELGFYYVDLRVKEANVPGATYHVAPIFGSKFHLGKIMTGNTLLSWKGDLYDLRQYQMHNPMNMILNAGWHFSNVGTPERIHRKLMAISHCHDEEFVGVTKESIAANRAAEIDLLGRQGVTFERHNDLPPYLLQNRERFREYFHP